MQTSNHNITHGRHLYFVQSPMNNTICVYQKMHRYLNNNLLVRRVCERDAESVECMCVCHPQISPLKITILIVLINIVILILILVSFSRMIFKCQIFLTFLLTTVQDRIKTGFISSYEALLLQQSGLSLKRLWLLWQKRNFMTQISDANL